MSIPGSASKEFRFCSLGSKFHIYKMDGLLIENLKRTPYSYQDPLLWHVLKFLTPMRYQCWLNTLRGSTSTTSTSVPVPTGSAHPVLRY